MSEEISNRLTTLEQPLTTLEQPLTTLEQPTEKVTLEESKTEDILARSPSLIQAIETKKEQTQQTPKAVDDLVNLED